MQPESRKYLFDIQVAADSIATFCAGKNFEDYLRDEMLKAAVERKFAVVGEALARLAQLDAGTAARIPDGVTKERRHSGDKKPCPGLPRTGFGD